MGFRPNFGFRFVLGIISNFGFEFVVNFISNLEFCVMWPSIVRRFVIGIFGVMNCEVVLGIEDFVF